jgi:hypothetical protein
MTTTKQSGKSFLSLRNAGNFAPVTDKVKTIQIGKIAAKSSAQAVTALAYGDNSNVNAPFRALDIKTRCEDYQDFAACISIIESYNEFDSDRILKAANWTLNKRHFLNGDNPNNGKSLFEFSIAREGSPAFYVQYNEKYGNKFIKDYEKVTDAENPGLYLYWEEYTPEDFKAEMSSLAASIGADEFDIEEQAYYGEQKLFTARFWFD